MGIVLFDLHYHYYEFFIRNISITIVCGIFLAYICGLSSWIIGRLIRKIVQNTDKDFEETYDRTMNALASNALSLSVSDKKLAYSYMWIELHKKEEAKEQMCIRDRLGAAEGVAKKAMENINRRVGRQIVVGAHSPSYGFEKNEQECEELIHIVNESGATVLLVGAGAPKQEKWIAKYRSRMSGVKLFMALGATIDFEAGNIKRAPRIFQILAMEWFYRFLKEPKRLFRRYFIDDIQFFYYFAKQLLGLYKDPFA